MNQFENPSHTGQAPGSYKLRKLSARQIEQIDNLLASVGEYGEVHLIVQRGELKYINKVESHRVRKEVDGSEEVERPADRPRSNRAG